MINLNECKFGDRLKAKNGRLMVFLGYNERLCGYDIALEEKLLPCRYGILHFNSQGESMHASFHEYDIIDKIKDSDDKSV